MTTGSTTINVDNLSYNNPKEVMLKKYIDKSNAELDRASNCFISWIILMCLIFVCCLSVYIFMKYT